MILKLFKQPTDGAERKECFDVEDSIQTIPSRHVQKYEGLRWMSKKQSREIDDRPNVHSTDSSIE